MKKIDFTNDDRKVIMEYLAAKQALAAAEVAEKAAKAKAKELFTRLGKEFKTTDKTSYLYSTVQIKGAAHAVVYKETTAKGAIDWKAYALAKGGTEAEAEQYRKRPTVRTSLDWATKDQQKELNQQQFINPALQDTRQGGIIIIKRKRAILCINYKFSCAIRCATMTHARSQWQDGEQNMRLSILTTGLQTYPLGKSQPKNKLT